MSRGKSTTRSSRHSTNKLGLARRHRRASFETLESRQLLSITLPTIIDQTVLAGAPLSLGLDVTSSTGNAINYEVSVSNPALTATIPQGNPSLKLVVDYVGNPSITTDDIHGTMVLQLAEDLAPETVAKITGLVNQNPGFYNGTTFHRIVKDFMIQGGAPKAGTAAPAQFDDEFHPALQFTSPGLLAMANGGDDTNASGFFITTAKTRWLDFNHTIFGVLTEGSDVLAQLNLVPVSGSTPLNGVVITSAEIITDTQDGVLRISTPMGTTGGATVTVTARDSVTGDSTSRTFNVTLAADTTNDAPPFIGQSNPIVATVTTPATFMIPATDVEHDVIYYDGSVNPANANLGIVVDHATGEVTLAPLAAGVYGIEVKVAPTASSTTWDTQFVPVYVNPAAPTSVVLTAASDTGSSNSDRITSLNNTAGKPLAFQVNGVLAGANVQLFADAVLIGSATASGTSVVVTTDGTTALPYGIRSITAKQTLQNQAVKVGNLTTTTDLASAVSAALSITIDQAPTNIAISKLRVYEKQAAGTTVGTFTTTDPDATDTFTYSLVVGDGSVDNASFTISGTTLKTASVFSYIAKRNYTIRVRSTDLAGLSTEKAFAITVDENNAPTDIQLQPTAIPSALNEGQIPGTVIGTLLTSDPDSHDPSSFTYKLVAGADSTDNASFTIVGDQLKTNAVLDYETQVTYHIRVRTEDAGGLTFEKPLTINITNVNEQPSNISLSSTTVRQGAAIGDPVGTLSTTDPDVGDTFTYTLVSGANATDNASFTIAGNTLKTAALLTKSSYSIRVRTTDQGGLGQSTEKVFTIKANNAPTDLSLSHARILEQLPAGATVGSLSTTDPDVGDAFTYSLVTGAGSADNASFTINGSTLRTAAPFDYGVQNSYSIRVRTTDQGGISTEKVFTISVAKDAVPTDIVLAPSVLAEDQPAGADVGQLTSAYTESATTPFTYTLVPGTGAEDNASFEIVGDRLKTRISLDYEVKTNYRVRVRSTTVGGLTLEKALTIGLANVNETPTAIAISTSYVPENKESGTVVGAFSTIDPDTGNTFTYSLVSGTGATNNASFSVSGGSLKTAASFNFEATKTYSIRVKSTDQGGLTTEKVFTINVTNVNEQPSNIAISSDSVLEGLPSGTVVGTLSTTDADVGDTYTYTLVGGAGSADNASFTIVDGTLKTEAAFNYQTKNLYSIRIRSTDVGGLWTEKVIAINITAAPISLSATTLAENQPLGTEIGTLTTAAPDSSGAPYTYTLVTGTGSADNDSFTIDGDKLKSNVVPNFEATSSYSVRVRSTSKDGVTTEQAFTINVTGVNEAPTGVSLSNLVLAEDLPIGSTVGTLTATDPDATDTTFTYTFVDGIGSADNGSFTIDGDTLKSNVTFDFGVQNIYTIRVKATDAGGLSTEKTFTLAVTNVNRQPTDIVLSSLNVLQNQPIGTTVGTFTTTDPDSGDTFTYTFASGQGSTNNGLFTISGNTLKTAQAFTYTAGSTYTIRVRSTDAGLATTDKVFAITVTNSSTAIKLSKTEVAEQAPIGTVVGTLTTSNLGTPTDTFTYELVAGAGDLNNRLFTISTDGRLLTNAVFDYDAATSYIVRVRATATSLQTTEQTFVISVIDVPKITEVTVVEAASPKNNKLEVKEKLSIQWSVDTANTIASLFVTVDNTNITAIGLVANGVYGATCGPLAIGTHQYTIRVTDSKGGTDTYTGEFDVVASTAPVISNVVIAESQYVNGTLDATDRISITWNASSENGLVSKSLRVDGQLVQWVTGPRATGATGVYEYSAFVGPLAAGTHSYTIEATDGRDVSSLPYTGIGTFNVGGNGTNQNAADFNFNAGDFNADGVSDVLWQNPFTGEVGAWLLANNGNTTGWKSMGVASAATWKVVGVANFDADGISDVLLHNQTTGEVGAWLVKNGVANGWKSMGSAPAATWKVVGVGRFDTDGISDVLLHNQTTGEIGAWLVKNGEPNGWKSMGAASAATWKVVGVGDFDANGISDVLLHNQTTGEVGAWLVKNGTPNGWRSMGGAPAATWKVVGVGDFDANGISDVLLHNQTTGEVGAWLVKNGTSNGWKSMGSAPAATWKVVGAGRFGSDGISDVLLHNQSTGEVGAWLVKTTSPNGWKSVGVAATKGAALLQVAEAAPATGIDIPAPTQSDLEPIITEAIARWAATGLDAAAIAKLGQVQFILSDLQGLHLGEAEANRIRIDQDAAGYGWFVDSTPADDAEFVDALSSQDLKARKDGPAGQRVDLLTAVMHEMGHILGYDHSSSLDLMGSTLLVGERKK